MARRDKKALADLRAMEEQMERKNPIAAKGATPTMGVSQMRGGAKKSVRHQQTPMMEESSSEEEMKGGMSHRVVGGRTRKMKPAMEKSEAEMEGGLMHMVYFPKSQSVSYMGKQARSSGGAKPKPKMLGAEMSKHLRELHGAGWWDDFASGFMSVVKPVASVLGFGDQKSGNVSGPGFEAVAGGAKKGGMFGGAKMGGEELLAGAGAKKVKRTMATNDPRRKRAEIVKKVMAEKKLGMIEASKYVKANNLY